MKSKTEWILIIAICISPFLGAILVWIRPECLNVVSVSVPTIVSFIVFVWLSMWQKKNAKIFPKVDPIFISFIPILFCLVAIAFMVFSRSEGSLSMVLGTLFGLATVFGLAISIAVLVGLREAVISEAAGRSHQAAATCQEETHIYIPFPQSWVRCGYLRG